MDPDFKNMIKSNEYCHKYPTLCWTIIAIYNLGNSVANRNGLVILICCGFALLFWKILVYFMPNVAKQSVTSFRRLKRNSSVERIFNGIDRVLNMISESKMALANKRTNKEREGGKQRTEVPEPMKRIGDSLNISGNSRVTLGIGATGRIEETSAEIGNRINLNTENALGTDKTNIEPIQVSAEVQTNVIDVPQSPRVGSSEIPKRKETTNVRGSRQKSPLNHRYMSPNRQVQNGAPDEKETKTKNTNAARAWKY